MTGSILSSGGKKGQVLLRIDSTGFTSNLGEVEAKNLALGAAVARLQTEASNADAETIDFPKALVIKAPEVVEAEKTLFNIRRSGLVNHLHVLDKRLQQKRGELAELQQALKRYTNNRDIAQREFKIKQAVAERGIISKVEVLRLEREIADLTGQIDHAGVDSAGGILHSRGGAAGSGGEAYLPPGCPDRAQYQAGRACRGQAVPDRRRGPR